MPSAIAAIACAVIMITVTVWVVRLARKEGQG